MQVTLTVKQIESLLRSLESIIQVQRRKDKPSTPLGFGKKH